jgi:hypothetical protein
MKKLVSLVVLVCLVTTVKAQMKNEVVLLISPLKFKDAISHPRYNGGLRTNKKAE